MSQEFHSEDHHGCASRKCDCAHIKGVCCDVKNCVHHDASGCCTAKEITVGPSYATTSNDTACATFRAID